MIFEATDNDINALDRFFADHIETSMFLRSNLISHGIGQSDHPHAMRYFVDQAGEDIGAVGAISNNGMLMVQAPDEMGTLANFMAGFLPAKSELAGILGEAGQVAAMSAALGLKNLPVQLDDVEPLMSLDLQALHIPDAKNLSLRYAGRSDLPLVSTWRLAYVIEAMNKPQTVQTETEAHEQALSMIDTGNYRILEHEGIPVSFTGFNATVPNCVQIGGVFTSPQLRSRGFARAAVALHLKEAKDAGVERSVLFASGEPAARAYAGIGFARIGSFTIKIFDKDTN